MQGWRGGENILVTASSECQLKNATVKQYFFQIPPHICTLNQFIFPSTHPGGIYLLIFFKPDQSIKVTLLDNDCGEFPLPANHRRIFYPRWSPGAKTRLGDISTLEETEIVLR